MEFLLLFRYEDVPPVTRVPYIKFVGQGVQDL